MISQIFLLYLIFPLYFGRLYIIYRSIYAYFEQLFISDLFFLLERN